MNAAVLLALASKWDRQANPPALAGDDGSEDGPLRRAQSNAHRACLADCAKQLRQLVELLGDDE